MSEHYFTCPKCGGHHFGRDTAPGGVLLDTVQCHNASDGQPFFALEDWVAAGKPKQKPCKWHGEWPVRKGAELILAERERQVSKEGWTQEHDDQHEHGELARAAAVYAVVEQGNVISILRDLRNLHGPGWPWEREWFKPFKKGNPNNFPEVDRIQCLVKSGALIAAEIDRLLRKEAKDSKQ